MNKDHLTISENYRHSYQCGCTVYGNEDMIAEVCPVHDTALDKGESQDSMN